MDDLHSQWEVPSIAHFFSLFKDAFGLVDFEVEELEQWLIDAGTEEGSPFLIDLLCRLLKGCYNNKKSINHENFEFHFRDIIKKKWELGEGRENPFYENDMNFTKLPLRTKVEMMYALCDYRLNADDVVDKMKLFDIDELRKEPVGRDSSGALYWYFFGTRLYKEIPDDKHMHTAKSSEGKKSRQKKSGTKTEDSPSKKRKMPSKKSVGSKKTSSLPRPTGRSIKSRVPRRIEDLIGAEGGTESDSSVSLGGAVKYSPILPPALHTEESENTVQSCTSTATEDMNPTASPPKLTPQVSACSQNNTDSEASSTDKCDTNKPKKSSTTTTTTTPPPLPPTTATNQPKPGHKSSKRMEDIISKLQQSLPTEVHSDEYESSSSVGSQGHAKKKKSRPPKLKENDGKSESNKSKKESNKNESETSKCTDSGVGVSAKSSTSEKNVDVKEEASDNESVASSIGSETSLSKLKGKQSKAAAKTKKDSGSKPKPAKTSKKTVAVKGNVKKSSVKNIKDSESSGKNESESSAKNTKDTESSGKNTKDTESSGKNTKDTERSSKSEKESESSSKNIKESSKSQVDKSREKVSASEKSAIKTDESNKGEKTDSEKMDASSEKADENVKDESSTVKSEKETTMQNNADSKKKKVPTATLR